MEEKYIDQKHTWGYHRSSSKKSDDRYEEDIEGDREGDRLDDSYYMTATDRYYCATAGMVENDLDRSWNNDDDYYY